MNYQQYKNLLGFFYPPERICIYPGYTDTLDEKDYFSGLGEIMKCAIMAGYDSFISTEANLGELLKRDRNTLLEEMKKALLFKKNVIEKDEFDKGYRNIMNYGHTFGHAIVSVSGYAIPHGQGVSFGIMIANRISVHRGILKFEIEERIRGTMGRIISSLPEMKAFLKDSRLLETMKKDKKYTGRTHACILFNGDGVQKYTDVTDEEVNKALISLKGMI